MIASRLEGDSEVLHSFPGVSVYQPTGYYNMSKIVAMFDSGAGVEVSVQHEQLVLNVFLPIEFVVSMAWDPLHATNILLI